MDYKYAFTSKDVRFISKGNIVYIIFLGWPGNGEVVKIDKMCVNDVRKIKYISFVPTGGHCPEFCVNGNRIQL